jgi:hypothetical protein
VFRILTKLGEFTCHFERIFPAFAFFATAASQLLFSQS